MTRAAVLIADDHAPTRADIAAALEEDGRFRVCAAVPDAPAAVEAAVRLRPGSASSTSACPEAVSPRRGRSRRAFPRRRS